MGMRAGIVGLGKMGRAHAEWIIQHGELELVAICEKNEERAVQLRKEFGVDVHVDLDRFLDESKLDLVVVVTTNDVHESATIKALDAKAHVIVEKPMSVSYESTKRMIAAAERNGKKILVHHSSRWDRDYALVRETIRSGKIGDVLCIQSKVMFCDAGWPSWGIDGMSNPWRIKARYGGGMLLDWGPHLVDQLVQMKGRTPKRVYGTVQAGVWSKEVDDYFFAALDFDDGSVCQIECSNTATQTLPRWFVTGTGGSIVLEGKNEPFWDHAIVTYKEPAGTQRTEAITLHDVNESGLEGGFYEDLLPYLNGETSDFVTMEEASNVIGVLELIKKSSDEKRVIDFGEIGPQPG